ILDALFELKIQSVIIEGGRQLLTSFINDGLWDEIRKLESNVMLNSGVAAPNFSGTPLEEINLDNNKLLIFFNDDKHTS
ncbi:MAG: riboflavin biosynthesis protein RibD, partial [bacterium]